MADQLQLKRRLNISAALTLVCGAVASAAIYLTASTHEQNSLVSEFRNSKAYHHELEAYGGKLSVVADELIRWFGSLWQGEALAGTVAAISAAVTILLFRLANRIPVAAPAATDKIADTHLKG